MDKWTQTFGRLKVTFYISNVKKDIEKVLLHLKCSKKVASTVALDMSGSNCRCLGTAFCRNGRGTVVVHRSGDVYAMSQVAFHEVGHHLAFHCGQDDKSEALADIFAALITRAGREEILCQLRRITKQLPPVKMRIPVPNQKAL
jgi:predicted heme/steroid binding protein